MRAVGRVLNALQETYPGLFVLPNGSNIRRQELIQELVHSERAHLNSLKVIAVRVVFLVYKLLFIVLHWYQNSGIILGEGLDTKEACLECFLVNCTRLLHYHDDVLGYLEDAVLQPLHEDWSSIFAFNVIYQLVSLFIHLTETSFIQDDTTSNSAVGAYKSYCANYLPLSQFLETAMKDIDVRLASFCLFQP